VQQRVVLVLLLRPLLVWTDHNRRLALGALAPLGQAVHKLAHLRLQLVYLVLPLHGDLFEVLHIVLQLALVLVPSAHQRLHLLVQVVGDAGLQAQQTLQALVLLGELQIQLLVLPELALNCRQRHQPLSLRVLQEGQFAQGL